MRSFLFISALLILTCISCNKGDDFKGEGQIRGRLVFSDSYSGDGKSLPLAGRSVKLAMEGSDTLNYKYSIVTDKEGYFTFTNLEDKKYDIFFRDTVGGTSFLAFDNRMPGEAPFLLEAHNDDTDQNGFFLVVRDNQNNPVGNSDICVFNNALLAQPDSCTGSIFQLHSDAFGRVVKYNLIPGIYYVGSRVNIRNTVYKQLQSIEVKAAGITTSDLILNPVPSDAKTGFDLLVQDKYGKPLYNCAVCVFNSRVLFEADSCAGSITQMTTNTDGEASLYNISANTYYLRVKGIYGNITLKGEGELLVQPDKVSTKIIVAE